MALTVQSIGRGQMAQMQTQNLGPKYNTRTLGKVPPIKSDELFTFFQTGVCLILEITPPFGKSQKVSSDFVGEPFLIWKRCSFVGM